MLEPRLLTRLEYKKTQLDDLQPLPEAEVGPLNQQLALEWIYNSNALEGSTLTLPETQLFLETGLTIGGKSLREHLEILNHKEAIGHVVELAAGERPIIPLHVRQIHKVILARIDDENAGNYRELPVHIAGASYQPPGPWEVLDRMGGWGEWLNGPALALHPVERAALAHHRLVAIHPFIDGNGRAARLVMNLLLMRDGYPPTIILRVNRSQYYRLLAQAIAGDEVPLVNLVGRAVERSLTRYLEACTPLTAPRPPEDEWIPLREAAQAGGPEGGDPPYTQGYLSLLARRGQLEAIKRGRVWYTTLRAVAAYHASISGRS
jgi:Fic family protein